MKNKHHHLAKISHTTSYQSILKYIIRNASIVYYFVLRSETTKFDMIIVLVRTIAKVVPITAMVTSNFGRFTLWSIII